MKYREEAKQLMERYLWEIERQLPISKRRDILREFKSNLLDMLEERCGEKEITEEDVSALLQELGSPEHIARQYRNDQVLIPASLFPLFKLVFSIVAVVLTVLFFIGLFVGIRGGEGVNILESLGSYLSSLIGAFGMMTLIFFFIYKYSPEVFEHTIEEPWNPGKLEKLEYQKSPGIAEPVFSIVFSLALIIVLTGFRDRLGYSGTLGNMSIYIPELGSRLVALIPILILRWLLEIGFNIILLVKRAWNEPLRISEVGLSIADIAILVLFLQGTPDEYIRFDLMEQAESFGAVAPVLRWVFTGIIVLILALTAFETFGKIKGLFVKPVSSIEL